MVESSGCRSRKIAGVVVLALVAVWFTPTPATAATGTTTRVSGTYITDRSAISADGRYVAFNTLEALVPEDTNSGADIYVHDRVINGATLVSMDDFGQTIRSGSFGGNPPAISDNGRYVVFESRSAIVSGDTNNTWDIFVRDRKAGRTYMASVASDGTVGNGTSVTPSVSADGTVVVFQSTASNLVAGDTNAAADVFVHDLSTRTTSRVSLSTSRLTGAQDPLGGQVLSPSAPVPNAVSGDGNRVVFTSSAPDMVSGDTNARADVFLHDRASFTTTRVSVATGGTQGNGSSGQAMISDDGNVVLFESAATNFSANDTNALSDAFITELSSGITALVTVSSEGAQANAALSQESPAVSQYAISGNGQRVVFASGASNLVTGDTNGKDDVFVHDRRTAETERVSLAHDDAQGNGNSYWPDVDASGFQFAFNSRATNLVPGGTNDFSKVFVRDTYVPPVVSVGDVAVHEGDAGTRAAVFTVSLSQPSPAAVTVAYATAGGTADGTDYTPKSGTVSFAAGSTNATVKVPVTGDTVGEGDESFTIGLSAATKAVIGDPTGVGTIVDDDPGTGRRLAIGDVAVHEGDAGARAAVFTVSLSKPSTSWVYVNYATAKGSAIGIDFTARSGTLRFAPGTTSLTVKVAITPDPLVEGTETFSVKLSAPSGASVADGIGVGTIIDND